MKYFFWYCLKQQCVSFNNSNICTVNAIQKKFVCLHEMGGLIKSSPLIKNAIAVSLFLLQFLLALFQYVKKAMKIYIYIYNSPPHVSVVTGNILITRIKFTRYHLLLATNSTFLVDSMYLGCNADLAKLE